MDDIHAMLCRCLDHGLHAQVWKGGDCGEGTPVVTSYLAGDVPLCEGVDCPESRVPQHGDRVVNEWSGVEWSE